MIFISDRSKFRRDFFDILKVVLTANTSRPIAKNTTNISQIYHKYTTKVLQNVILYHKNVILYHKNVILYHKTECFTTKCNILPHSVVLFKNNPTTNCSILLQNIVIYHKMMYYIMNSSISTTEVVFYHIM